MGTRDNVDGDQFSDFLGTPGAGFNRCLTGGDIAPDDSGDITAADPFIAYQFYFRR